VKHVPATDHAQLDLSFACRQGRTVLDRRLFSYPYVLMRTFSEPSGAVHPRSGNRLLAVVQNCSGPVHDRDDFAINLVSNVATEVRMLFQGATAIHRARPGNASRERLRISLADASHLSYLPAPRILFPGAAHRQSTEIELEGAASLVFTDAFTLHDPEGQGRSFRELDSTLSIRRAGELLLLDRQHLLNPLDFKHYRAFGSILLLGLDAPRLPDIPGLYAAASRLPAELGWSVRLAAPDLAPIRDAFAALT